MTNILKAFINSQIWLSQKFDKILPEKLLSGGRYELFMSLAPDHAKEGMKIYDVGGGKFPTLSPELKKSRNLTIIGVDIDDTELKKAPSGYYDGILVVDLMDFQGPEDGDLVIANALLEHIPDNAKALRGIKSLVKPGGKIVAFAPCRYAAFAILNSILPESAKRAILKFVYDEQSERMGFRAFYNLCTPKEMSGAAKSLGLEIEYEGLHYDSNYMQVFTPVHIVWRLYQLVIYGLGIRPLVESFTYVFVRPASDADLIKSSGSREDKQAVSA